VEYPATDRHQHQKGQKQGPKVRYHVGNEANGCTCHCFDQCKDCGIHIVILSGGLFTEDYIYKNQQEDREKEHGER